MEYLARTTLEKIRVTGISLHTSENVRSLSRAQRVRDVDRSHECGVKIPVKPYFLQCSSNFIPYASKTDDFSRPMHPDKASAGPWRYEPESTENR